MSVREMRAHDSEPSRRERQRLATRGRLFEAALEEFRSVGFARAQIDRIVERAGVARGTFYFHFPTKDHVLIELQRRSEAGIVERIASLGDPPASVEDFLLGLLDAIHAEAQGIGVPELSREIIAMYVRRSHLVDASSLPLVVAIVDFFTGAAERGEIRTDIPPEEVTGVFLITLFGFAAGGVDEERLPVFRRIIEVFVRGIAP